MAWLPSIIHQFSIWVAVAAAGGAGVWAILIVIDTVLGIIGATGNGGTRSWDYFLHFLVSNFATQQVAAILGAAGLAGAGALAVYLTGANGQVTIHAAYQVFASAAGLAFTTGVVAQDVSLIKDICSKIAAIWGKVKEWGTKPQAQGGATPNPTNP